MHIEAATALLKAADIDITGALSGCIWRRRTGALDPDQPFASARVQ